MLFAGMDNLLQAGEIHEFGYFLDGTSGYSIGTGESKDMFSRTSSFIPWVVAEVVHEVVPYKTAKEVMRGFGKPKQKQ
jgi:hypothetical protein